MILEPVLNAACVEIVLHVARERHNLLLRLELSQTYTALVLICKLCWAPFDSKHLLKHNCGLSLLLPSDLSLLEPLIEAIRNEAGEKEDSENKNNCWEGPDYQHHVVDNLHDADWSFTAGWWGLDHSEKVFKGPKAERGVPVDAQGK